MYSSMVFGIFVDIYSHHLKKKARTPLLSLPYVCILLSPKQPLVYFLDYIVYLWHLIFQSLIVKSLYLKKGRW